MNNNELKLHNDLYDSIIKLEKEKVDKYFK